MFSLAGVLVLLVDDDADSRAVVRDGLTRAGAVVKEAASAAEARRWLDTWTPSVIVTDLVMPNEDGFEFVRRLRASVGPERRCKTIALTGVGDALRERAVAAGFDAFVTKSVPVEILTAVVFRFDRARDLGSGDSGDP